MPFALEHYAKLYEAADVAGMDSVKQRSSAAALHKDIGGNKRQIEIGILFFARCRTRNKHHFGLTIEAARYALEQAFEDGQKTIIENTIWCLEDYVAWSETVEGNRRPGIRAILNDFADRQIPSESLLDAKTLDAQIEQDATEVRSLSDDQLLSRLSTSSNEPVRKIKVISTMFCRDPVVREIVIRRANGLCEHAACRAPMPFKRKDGSTFLEVHHIFPLADGGPDTVDNSIALCPNCHREAHHGEYWQKFRA